MQVAAMDDKPYLLISMSFAYDFGINPDINEHISKTVCNSMHIL